MTAVRGQKKLREELMRNSFFGLSLSALLLALCLPADAQQPTKIPRIGYLSGNYPADPGPNVEAFRQALRGLGYVEEKKYSD
jgi:hypothetical protein